MFGDLPSSSEFFRGKEDAEKGKLAPSAPHKDASYESKMYYLGFMQQIRRSESIRRLSA